MVLNAKHTALNMHLPSYADRSSRKRALPKKLQAVLTLVATVLVISHFFQGDERAQHRDLKRCKPISELLESLEDEEVRQLHNLDTSSRDFYKRVLELGGESPCLIDFPEEVEDAVADDEIIGAKTHPDFEVAAYIDYMITSRLR